MSGDHLRGAIEASMLGGQCPPGVWPPSIDLDGVNLLRAAAHRDSEGEIQWVNYKAPGSGFILQVFND